SAGTRPSWSSCSSGTAWWTSTGSSCPSTTTTGRPPSDPPCRTGPELAPPSRPEESLPQDAAPARACGPSTGHPYRSAASPVCGPGRRFARIGVILPSPPPERETLPPARRGRAGQNHRRGPTFSRRHRREVGPVERAEAPPSDRASDTPWPRAVQAVIDWAARAGLALDVTRYPEGTRTAEDAARAIGCAVGQIVKSLVFIAGKEPIIALVSGANRADTGALSRLCGGVPVRQARAAEVREATGFAIGGVPPFGYPRP